jgi:serine/threonine protein phosphatase PrpC
MCVENFEYIRGFYAGVFDGHGGDEVSEKVSRELHKYID